MRPGAHDARGPQVTMTQVQHCVGGASRGQVRAQEGYKIGGGVGTGFQGHFSIMKGAPYNVTPIMKFSGNVGEGEGRGDFPVKTYFILNIVHLPKFRIATYTES